ncbi:MAG: glycosyltransferase [Hydrogenobaculum sp.]|nr:MAG: glycosyl transferase family 1 [Hydrogenobaculum sp.]
MKLLDITHFYSDKSGGIKTYINNKIEYVKDKDIEHVVIVPGNKDTLNYINRSKIYQIKSPYMFVWKQYRLLVNQQKITNIIEFEKPDIVEIGSLFLLPSFIKKLKDKLNFSTVGFFHSNLEKSLLNVFKLNKDNNMLSKITRKYIYKTYSEMDLIIAPSYYVKDYLNLLGLYNVEVVYHGIDFNIFENQTYNEELKNLLKDKIVLLYVGRFSKDKNFLELLDIFKILKNLDKRFHLLLVGEGPDKKHISKILDSDFTVLDYIKDKKILTSIYKLSHIFVSASKSDTFGYAVIEAQACGLPVVAYNDVSFPEIVYYKEFLANSKEEFIQNILTLSKVYPYLDKSPIKTFVKERFSLEKNMSHLFYIYHHLNNRLAYQRFA